ncbi:RcnB family protein [Sphingomonas sp.]|uniref:RcnB family protein n=1 Tax=Sphingomonas sp. TaxID=28214 RepID=UPI003B00D880
MRVSMLLGVGAALMTAGGAEAQRGPGAPYPMPGRQVVPGPGVHYPPLPQPPMTQPPTARPPIVTSRGPQGPGRWGSRVDGRWWGGSNAPGGWAAYRQPYRGYRVPPYWVAPRFYVTDWQDYGLTQPWAGYNWVRYYDDAVLIDRGGLVYDVRGGIDWDGVGPGGDYAYDERRGDRGSNGVDGAVAGAVVGGVAGNVIAGRGNRLGGTLIGAGVGAAAGYAIDREHGREHGRDRDRRGPPPGYDGYGEPPMAPDGPPPPPSDMRGYPGSASYPQAPSNWVSGDGRTTVTTTTSGGYAPPPVIVSGGGYGYGYGGSVTTVTIQSAPVVTTTTTEIIEDRVTWTRPVVRRVAHRRVWRPRPRPRCVCGS